MKPRWELGVLLTAAFFSSAQAFTSSDCSSSFISDGWCDSTNNNSDCDYDGGDCCVCDCFDDTFDCGVVGFTCIDPTSDCIYHHYDDDDSQTTYDGFFDSSDASEEDNASEDDNDRATSDDAPVGAIVGGVVGGTAFLAAAAVLGCLFFTGRLKCSKCSSSSDPPAAPTPAGDGTTRAAIKAYPAPVASAAGAPAGPRNGLPPPPAFLAPAGDRSAQSATETYPEPTASAAAAPAAPAGDLPPPPAYGSHDHDATFTAAPPPPYGHPVNQYPQPK